MSKYLIFETERLWLRPTLEEDTQLIMDVFNTPGALEYIGDRNIRTREDAMTFIAERTLRQLRKKTFANYTLIEKRSGAKVGVCGLYDRPGIPYVDLGYALLPEYERRGFAAEASRRLMEAARDEFGLTELAAFTHPENTRSQKTLDNLGFEYVKQVEPAGFDGPSLLYVHKF